NQIIYTSPQELAAGIFPILELNKEVEAIELYRLVSRQLGFSAVSKEIASALRESINYLVEENLLAIHGDKIILCY
ncbi:MAG: hypothetical protein GY756_22400, partial [bacterium]|nr:hypothetical protein [bacterium]